MHESGDWAEDVKSIINYSHSLTAETQKYPAAVSVDWLRTPSKYLHGYAPLYSKTLTKRYDVEYRMFEPSRASASWVRLIAAMVAAGKVHVPCRMAREEIWLKIKRSASGALKKFSHDETYIDSLGHETIEFSSGSDRVTIVAGSEKIYLLSYVHAKLSSEAFDYGVDEVKEVLSRLSEL